NSSLPSPAKSLMALVTSRPVSHTAPHPYSSNPDGVLSVLSTISSPLKSSRPAQSRPTTSDKLPEWRRSAKRKEPSTTGRLPHGLSSSIKLPTASLGGGLSAKFRALFTDQSADQRSGVGAADACKDEASTNQAATSVAVVMGMLIVVF